MPLVHVGTADGTRTRVQIFVAAPYREVRIIGMQRQRHVADRVSQVKACQRAGAMRRGADARQIEQLSGAILHAWPQDQRQT
jgi:hypothetical protein